MTKPDENQMLAHTLRDTNVPPENRADLMIFCAAQKGLDARPVLADILKEADEGRVLKAKAEEQQRQPLTAETYVGSAEVAGRTFAVVTHGGGDVYLPCEAAEINELAPGDPILLDPRELRIVGRDGAIPTPGDVVTVESVPDPRHVVVRHHDQLVKARLSQRLTGTAPPAPGARVVYSASTRFVHEVIDTRSDGQELLVEHEALAKVSRADLGAPHPVLEEILFRLKMWVTHADWMRVMYPRPRMSYLLVGSTGTGKTMHLRLAAREFADFLEELTGQRVSRLVLCDASSFYSPWFGQTEQNINRWFDQIARLASTPLKAKDGRPVHAPLLITLEEAEGLFRSRGESGGSSHLFDRPLAQLLQKLDSLTDHLSVPLVFCATTNRPDLLDAAARRRIGIAQVVFGNLTAGQAASVLAKKLPAGLPLRGTDEADQDAARQALIQQVVGYLYGNDPEQGLVEVVLRNNERRTLHRRDVVTPALIEMAVSGAIDEGLRQSAEAGRLLGVDGAAVVRALHAQFNNLAVTLRPHNLREHCPEWFAEEPLHVDDVRPLVQRKRRPRSLLVR